MLGVFKYAVMSNFHIFIFQGFFEEIEDLKFGLKQATKLNKEYEKTLRKLCIQFGVPYPHPENCLNKPT